MMSTFLKKGAVALLLLTLGGVLFFWFGRKECIRDHNSRIDFAYDGLYLERISGYIDGKPFSISTMPPRTILFWNARREVEHLEHLWPESYTHPCDDAGGFQYHSVVRGDDVEVTYDWNCDGIIDAAAVLGPGHPEATISLEGHDVIVLKYLNYGPGFMERPRPVLPSERTDR